MIARKYQPRNRTLVSAGRERSCERNTSFEGSGVDITPCHIHIALLLAVQVLKPHRRQSMSSHVPDRHRRVMAVGGENGTKASTQALPASTSIQILEISEFYRASRSRIGFSFDRSVIFFRANQRHDTPSLSLTPSYLRTPPFYPRNIANPAGFEPLS